MNALQSNKGEEDNWRDSSNRILMVQSYFIHLYEHSFIQNQRVNDRTPYCLSRASISIPVRSHPYLSRLFTLTLLVPFSYASIPLPQMQHLCLPICEIDRAKLLSRTSPFGPIQIGPKVKISFQNPQVYYIFLLALGIQALSPTNLRNDRFCPTKIFYRSPEHNMKCSRRQFQQLQHPQSIILFKGKSYKCILEIES